ncbi:asparagine synthetase B family protein [Streptomyces sp. UG1]|uniref:asparagine synthetase B family protein n=1 Tax=Streptomyces sp. UG1 TaxID=3417652 RepID=UPI003CF09073
MHFRLVHRGPDETYSLNTETISVKLGRLGFTGLVDDWQPAEDHTGRYVAMTNGEVFNARALRDTVGADRQNNGVDVSVVPELVAQYGIEGLRLMDGQFATVVFDRAENSLFLARDRFGICPMYYTVTGSDVHFCSEIKPLVQCVDRSWKVDIGAVDQYFSMGNIVAPRTLVKEVQAVPPGCAVKFDANDQETLRYWRYGEFSPTTEPVSDEMLRENLKQSIRDRLHADVEIGAYLSGSFDSTAILVEATALTGRPFRTFSVVFDDPGLTRDASSVKCLLHSSEFASWLHEVRG